MISYNNMHASSSYLRRIAYRTLRKTRQGALRGSKFIIMEITDWILIGINQLGWLAVVLSLYLS